MSLIEPDRFQGEACFRYDRSQGRAFSRERGHPGPHSGWKRSLPEGLSRWKWGKFCHSPEQSDEAIQDAVWIATSRSPSNDGVGDRRVASRRFRNRTAVDFVIARAEGPWQSKRICSLPWRFGGLNRCWIAASRSPGDDGVGDWRVASRRFRNRTAADFVIARAEGPWQSRRPCSLPWRFGGLGRRMDCHVAQPGQ